jgi:RNA polymerase sigma-70 factor (ECF subfamily)
MSADALDDLLERLTNGETEAAGQVFQTFEPILRVMVRRRLTPRLRAKFDSMDVVQSVWTDVLKGYREEGWKFTDREHLRAY